MADGVCKGCVLLSFTFDEFKCKFICDKSNDVNEMNFAN